MKKLHLFNTLTKKVDEFYSIEPNKVKMYCCGPTVYNYAHIGNLRTYIFEDVLKRVLKFNGYDVIHVVNITDVGHLVSDADDGNDKMELSASKQNMTAWQIAEFYTKAFKNDFKRLNIIEPDIWCKATDHIKEQIDFVKGLEEKGVTYIIDDGVYFDTSKIENYGKLAGIKNIDNNIARVTYNEQKRNPTDFALWKFSPKDKQRQMEWDSPWGVGFPGWHIECSAMSRKYLGDRFDIHCGGIDHVPIHHTNEIAQTETLTGHEWVNWWLHGEFLVVNKNEKMAKSGGNFITVETLIEKNINPLVYRFYCLGGNYRKQLMFSWQAMEDASNGFNNLVSKVSSIGNSLIGEGKVNNYFIEKFLDALNDDLNTAVALSVMWEVLNDSNISNEDKYATLLKMDEVLGLGFSEMKEENLEVSDEIKELVEERNVARKNKNFKVADDIRSKLFSMGYELDDTKEGTIIRKVTSSHIKNTLC